MKEFPPFMQHPVNRIAIGSQTTPGVEGYVFDGADGSQMDSGLAAKPPHPPPMPTTTTNTCWSYKAVTP
jgi:hypothetical protein